MSIPIDIKIQFVEILIRSFSSLHNFTTGEQRQNWIRTRFGASFGDHLDGLFELYFDSADSLEKAELKLNQLVKQQTNSNQSHPLQVDQVIAIVDRKLMDAQIYKEKKGVTTCAQFTQQLKKDNRFRLSEAVKKTLEKMVSDNFWPCYQRFITFPSLGDREQASVQPFFETLIKEMSKNASHSLRLDESGSVKTSKKINPPNQVIDAHNEVSFNHRKPDIVMYKNNERYPCSITVIGEIKGREYNGEFTDEQIGQILDTASELMENQQYLRKFMFVFLTDGYRFQFFKCSRNESFSVECTPVYIGLTGWQIFFALRNQTPEKLGLVQDYVEGWTTTKGLGVGRFSRVYEVKSENHVGSFVLKYFSEQYLKMGTHEYEILNRLNNANIQNIPVVIDLIQSNSVSALIVSPVGIPIITASKTYQITPSMFVTLLDVLIHAHQLNIIHRDVKPENIFIVTDGTRQNILLNDWGSAVISSEPCYYQGTPIYGDQVPQESEFQFPTPALDLCCLVKTVFTIKQQKYPPALNTWSEITSYWNNVSTSYPEFDAVFSYASQTNYEELRAYFNHMWY